LRFALAAVLTLFGAVACSSAGSSPPSIEPDTPSTSGASGLTQLAFQLAGEDRQPARRGTYLVPLERLHRDCRNDEPSEIKAVVESLVTPLQATGTIRAPRAESAAVLAADAHAYTNCYSLAAQLGAEIDKPSVSPAGAWKGQTTYVHFAPAVTADIALAAIRNVVLSGSEHPVYTLTADECQQVVYLGSELARVTGSSSLGAFVELSSGAGVAHTPYDANRVDTARITVLGAIGGEPCT
jgi:hypothetical protein